ncbi:MAG: prepilin-type N-terminal cleavage/methylation domain-containing protein [Planctomycetota bacterium]
MEQGRRSADLGFTLLELVLAVAILATAVLSMLSLRTSAVDRASVYTRDRAIRRLAQEKLDEVVFGIEEELSGTLEWRRRPRSPVVELPWEVRVQRVSTDGPELLECTITVTYSAGSSSQGSEEEEYQLGTWIFPDDESPLLDEADGGLPGEGE